MLEAIVIGGSAGALDALHAILPSLPADSPAAVMEKIRRRRPSVSLVSVTWPRAARRGGSVYSRVCGKDQKFPSVAQPCRSSAYGVDGPSRAGPEDKVRRGGESLV
jgi:hypothetical protein